MNIGFDWDSTWGGAPNTVRNVLNRGTSSTVPSSWSVAQWIDADAGGHGPLDIKLKAGPYSRGSPISDCVRINHSDGTQGDACPSSQVSGDPLTVAFDEVPASHDGTAFDFEVEFSEAVTATATQMQSAVGATGGTVTAAALATGSDKVWDVTVTPSGTGTVTLSLGLPENCTDTGAICTSDGRKLSNALAQEVAFAPRLSVADAEATEGDGHDARLHGDARPGSRQHGHGAIRQLRTAPQRLPTTTRPPTGRLTFSTNETSKTVSVPIVDDTVEDDGETFTLTLSNPTSAVLADAEATGTIRNTETSTAAALTASFQNVPASHDGENTFTFGLVFSEDVEGLSYETLRDDAFSVTAGEVTTAERQSRGQNRNWTIHVEPDGRGAVTITLPEGAVTTNDSRSLESAVTATVAGPPTEPLTASFQEVPASHDGENTFTFGLQFSEDVEGLSYETLGDDAFDVTGGEVTTAKRKTQGENQNWTIHVEPDGTDDVSITLPAGAVTTTDDRSLQAAVSATVTGPPVGVSVADAEVDEAEDAVLSFAVTLSRAAEVAMTVDYATSDSSATAGSDYTAATGTLSFVVGDSSATIDVAVSDDEHDEGNETLTLTLSNPSSGELTDGEATGTIKNHDPLPLALVARFGRVAAGHVVDQVEQRMEAPRGAGFDGRFAGRELRRGAGRDFALGFLNQLRRSGGNTGGGGTHQPMAGWSMGGTSSLGTTPMGHGGARPPGASRHGRDGGSAGRPAGRPARRRIPPDGLRRGGDLLTGSGFALNREAGESGGILSFWSRGAQSHFAGQDGALSLGGGVRTTMFGADYSKGRGRDGPVAVAQPGLGRVRRDRGRAGRLGP